MIVDAKKLGFDIKPDEAKELASLGVKITAAANDQLGFTHPTNPDWQHISLPEGYRLSDTWPVKT